MAGEGVERRDVVVEKAVDLQGRRRLAQEEPQGELLGHTAEPPEASVGEAGGQGDHGHQEAAGEQGVVAQGVPVGQPLQVPQGPFAFGDAAVLLRQDLHVLEQLGDQNVGREDERTGHERGTLRRDGEARGLVLPPLRAVENAEGGGRERAQPIRQFQHPVPYGLRPYVRVVLLADALTGRGLCVPGLAGGRVVGRDVGTVGGVEALLGEILVEFDLAALDPPVREQFGALQQFVHQDLHRVLGELQRRSVHEDLQQGAVRVDGHDAVEELGFRTVGALQGLDGLESVLEEGHGARSLEGVHLRSAFRDAGVHSHYVRHTPSFAGRNRSARKNGWSARSVRDQLPVASLRCPLHHSAARCVTPREPLPPPAAGRPPPDSASAPPCAAPAPPPPR
ncbi:hypothetical protein SGRIM119S_00015 [Streptomyces griseorubiginosus]